MGEINPLLVNNEIDRFGATITLIAVTDSSYSDWGDANESTSSTEITAIVTTLSQDDEYVKEGVFQAGDKVFFVKSDQTINRESRIIHGGNTYEIQDILEHEIEGNNQVKEVRTRKV